MIAVTDIDSLRVPISEWATALIDGGVDIIQLRQPDRADEDIEALARVLLESLPADRLQINGRPLIANALGCRLHLPERSVIQVRHDRHSAALCTAETARMASSCDFVVAGHVCATPSHPGEAGRGVAWLAEMVAESPVPVIAIGGIDATNAASCIQVGASGVAVIRALTVTERPYEAARALRNVLDNAALARSESRIQ
ncbi:MAG: thiamine phosphate synthase [Thermomicrobiales bacterium]